MNSPAQFYALNDYEIMLAEHHLFLEKIINQLHYSHVPLHQLSHSLNGLREQLKVYFANEEALIKKHDYPDFKQHKIHHLELLMRLADFCVFTAEKRNCTARDVSQYLATWLDHHIDIEERRFFKYLVTQFDRHESDNAHYDQLPANSETTGNKIGSGN